MGYHEIRSLGMEEEGRGGMGVLSWKMKSLPPRHLDYAKRWAKVEYQNRPQHHTMVYRLYLPYLPKRNLRRWTDQVEALEAPRLHLVLYRLKKRFDRDLPLDQDGVVVSRGNLVRE